jgi:hypothetical protein
MTKLDVTQNLLILFSKFCLVGPTRSTIMSMSGLLLKYQSVNTVLSSDKLDCP